MPSSDLEPDYLPPPSPRNDDRQAGLFDDPYDLDQFRLALEDVYAAGASDEEEEDPPEAVIVPQPPPPADLPDPPPAQAPPDILGNRPASPANELGDVAIPGVSELEHPALAHALDLPPLPPSLSPRTVYTESHPLWYVRVILLLVAYLHTHHHVTFRAADLTLSTLRTLFVALNLIDQRDPMPRTLTTTMKRLDLTDKFYILIECAACRRLFRPDIANRKLHCFNCNTPLFTTTSRSLLVRLLRRDAPIPIPRTVAPLCLLSTAILYLIRQPGIEAYFDAYKTRMAPPPGEYRSIHDGSRWKILVGSDGKPFFGPDHNGELRIPVILHVDW